MMPKNVRPMKSTMKERPAAAKARGSLSRSVDNGSGALGSLRTFLGIERVSPSEPAAARSKAVIFDDGKRKCSVKGLKLNDFLAPTPRHSDTPTPASSLGRAAGRGLVFAFALFLILFPAITSKADAFLSIGTARAEPGSTVSVPLTLTGATNVVALQGDVLFDPAVLSAGATTGGPALAGQIFGYSTPTSGVHRVLVYSLNNLPLSTGVIASLRFNITPKTPASAAGLSLTNIILATTNATALASSNSSGLVAINLLQIQTNGSLNGFVFGTDGKRYVIQATTNFFDWVNIDTNFAVGAFIRFTDSQAANNPSGTARTYSTHSKFGGPESANGVRARRGATRVASMEEVPGDQGEG